MPFQLHVELCSSVLHDTPLGMEVPPHLIFVRVSTTMTGKIKT